MGGGAFFSLQTSFWILRIASPSFFYRKYFYWNNKINIRVLVESMLLQPPRFWMSHPPPQFSKTMLQPTKNSVLMKSYINIKCFIHESSTENYILLHSYLQQLEKQLQKYHEIISYLLHKYELHDIHNMISMIRWWNTVPHDKYTEVHEYMYNYCIFSHQNTKNIRYIYLYT